MAEMAVGVRDLKTRLSEYIRQVKSGTTVVVTERGKPIGRMVSLSTSPDMRVQELIQVGLAAWYGRKLPPMPDLAPIPRTRGSQTIADLLLEDRE
ncbi:MAG: type II toxin-antitoxin system prevent-host-death family antitoxin [Chloroflexi bacterium]|nr:type II toxin-antitoxin system prevent-host-death family antitoxin [Chloroflexota bacterium]